MLRVGVAQAMLTATCTKASASPSPTENGAFMIDNQ
jgi:hypothetical protein